MSITSKRGDTGQTENLRGIKMNKDSPVLEVIGTLDEFTSALGMAKCSIDKIYHEEIDHVQDMLIEIMAYLSSDGTRNLDLDASLMFLESRIEHYEGLFPGFKHFIKPGAYDGTSKLDFSRTIIRRAERAFFSLEVGGSVGVYLNRLSDYLYVLARAIDFSELVKESLGRVSSGPLTLDRAIRMADAVLKEAKKQSALIVVSIYNHEGNKMLTYRMDEAYVISTNLAEKKAYTSAVLKMTTTELKELTRKGGDFEGLEDMIKEDIVTLGGGCPIVEDGHIIGGIGVSGSSVEMDEYLAQYGSDRSWRSNGK